MNASTEPQQQVAADYPGGVRRRRKTLADRFKKFDTWFVPGLKTADYIQFIKRHRADGDAMVLCQATAFLSGGQYRKPGRDGQSLEFTCSNEDLGELGFEWHPDRIKRGYRKLEALGDLKITSDGYRGQKRKIVFLGSRTASGQFIPAFLQAAENASTQPEASVKRGRFKTNRPQNEELDNSLEGNESLPSEGLKKKKGITSPKRAKRAEGGARPSASPAGRKSRRTRKGKSRQSREMLPARSSAPAPAVDAFLVDVRLPDPSSPDQLRALRAVIERYGDECEPETAEYGGFKYSSSLPTRARNVAMEYSFGLKTRVWLRDPDRYAMQLGEVLECINILSERRKEVAQVRGWEQRRRQAVRAEQEAKRAEQEMIAQKVYRTLDDKHLRDILRDLPDWDEARQMGLAFEDWDGVRYILRLIELVGLAKLNEQQVGIIERTLGKLGWRKLDAPRALTESVILAQGGQ